MRILLDILHPAHVLFFRHFIDEMIGKNHSFFVASREKDLTLPLLNSFEIPHSCLSTQRKSPLGLGLELLSRTAQLSRIIRRWKPDVLAGVMGPSIAPLGRLHRIPSLVFYDSEFAFASNAFVYRLADYVITPESYAATVPGNHLRYPGYQKSAYLHPNRFTPDKEKLKLFGLSQTEPYVIFRLVSWQASHDWARARFGEKDWAAAIEKVAQQFRVLISCESPLPQALEPYAVKGPVTNFHHLLSFAHCTIGDSPTTSAEATLLGTPALIFSPFSCGYLNDLSKRSSILRLEHPAKVDSLCGAVERFLESIAALNQVRPQPIEHPDVTAWMCTFFENTNFCATS